MTGRRIFFYFLKLKIILMYFRAKNILKNNRYYNLKHSIIETNYEIYEF
jgi:hypothetical protein